MPQAGSSSLSMAHGCCAGGIGPVRQQSTPSAPSSTSYGMKYHIACRSRLSRAQTESWFIMSQYILNRKNPAIS